MADEVPQTYPLFDPNYSAAYNAYLVAVMEHFGVASLTIENYVKTIYQTCIAQSGNAAATGQISDALGVSPGTVTSMLKTLSESGLAVYTPYVGVQLTDAGRMLALRVVRRHRLIELFLVRTLDLTWDEVHEEAENMEHAVSDLLVDRIDEFLGHPAVDPHGDPIPKADGTVSSTSGRCLSDLRPAEQFELVRVLDQSSEFLRYLTENHLPLGATGKILTNNDEAGLLTIRVASRETTLSREVARKLVVATPVEVA